MNESQKIIFSQSVLVIVTGVPGSGKTTLSLGLYGRTGRKEKKGVLDFLFATYIDKDMINDGFTVERTGEFYQTVRKGTYIAVDNIIKRNLELGNSVWIDATFSTEVKDLAWANRYYQMAKEYNAKLKLIRCSADEEVIKNRLRQRGYQRDIDKLNDWDKFLSDEPIYLDVPYGGIALDSSNSLDKNIESVLDFLRK